MKWKERQRKNKKIKTKKKTSEEKREWKTRENIWGNRINQNEGSKGHRHNNKKKYRTTLRFKSINSEQINAFCMCFYFLTNIFPLVSFRCLSLFFLLPLIVWLIFLFQFGSTPVFDCQLQHLVICFLLFFFFLSFLIFCYYIIETKLRTFDKVMK